MRDTVFETVGKDTDGKPDFHYNTDAHNHNGGNGDGRFDGCGHCKLLKNEPERYGLMKEQAAFLQSTLEALERDGVKPAVLQGNHNERAVFVTSRVWDIDSLDIENPQRLTHEQVNAPGVKAWVLEHQAQLPNESSPSQAFVYRRGMVDLRLRAFAKQLEEQLEGANISETELVDALKMVEANHLEVTTSKLAAGKPVYEVFIDAKTGKYKVVGPA